MLHLLPDYLGYIVCAGHPAQAVIINRIRICKTTENQEAFKRSSGNTGIR